LRPPWVNRFFQTEGYAFLIAGQSEFTQFSVYYQQEKIALFLLGIVI